MKLTSKYLFAALLAAVFFAWSPSMPVRADSPLEVSQQFPIDYRVGMPCREGVSVLMSGTLHVTIKFFQDANGGYHTISHGNWQGVSGVNEQTGETYHFVTTGHAVANSSTPLSQTSNFVTTGRTVVQGEGVVLYVHNIYHLTITPEGEIAAQFSHQSADCEEL